jgi:hypothetical protein
MYIIFIAIVRWGIILNGIKKDPGRVKGFAKYAKIYERVSVIDK